MAENIQIVATAQDKASPTLKKLQTNIGALGSKTGGPLGGMLSGFAGLTSPVLAAGAAIGVATAFVGDAIGKASELQETISKSKVIFGDNAGVIEDWGETAADTFGQSKQDALDTASTFAGLFDTVGFAADEAATKAQRMTELGSDLASFFNTDVTDAVMALRSGLSGESEPLRKFNVFLSETAVQAKAAQLGLKGVNGKLTEGEKIQARYAIIMEQTSAAQGDFARTSEGLANSQRSLQASFEDVQAEIGEKFLPIVTDAVNFLKDTGVPALEVMVDAADEMPVVKLLELAGAMTELAGASGKVGEAWDSGFLGDVIKSGSNIAPFLIPAAEIIEAAENAGKEAGIEYGGEFVSSAAQALQAANESEDRIHTAMAQHMTQQSIDALEAEMRSERRRLQNIGGFMASEIAERYETVGEQKMFGASQGIMREVMDGLVDGVRSNKGTVQGIMEDLTFAITHPLAGAKAIAKVEGALTGEKLGKALQSKNPFIRHAAEQARDALIEQWEGLSGTAWNRGSAAGHSLVRGFNAAFDINDLDFFGGWGKRNPGAANTGSGIGNGRRRKRAAGGSFSAGDTVIVNERSGELVNVGRQGGSVTPSHKLGGGGDVYLDGEKVGRVLDRRMGRQMAFAPG